MSKITAASAEGTPPSDFDAFDFDNFDEEVYFGHLLGRGPTGRIRDFRAEHPKQWLRYNPSREYFHWGLIRLLQDRGGTAKAAESIRHDLEDGRICAVVIDHKDGEACQIPPQRWRAATTSAEMYWTGWATIWGQDGPGPHKRPFEGDIYLTEAPQPESAPEPVKVDPEPPPADWWPKPGQSQTSWVKSAAVEHEAERRVKAAGVNLTETAKAKAMEAMASEAGREWRSDSISTLRRR